MGDKTGIQWTDATWNPTVGCSVISPGCTNCYAMRQAARLARMGQDRYKGLTVGTKSGPVWTGEVRAAPDDTIALPLRWLRPRRIFVDSMSDLFHPNVPFGLVMRVWSVMARTPQHTYQILTKRPDRMREFLALWVDLAGESEEPQLVRGLAATRAAHPSGRGRLFADMLEAMGEPPPGAVHPTFDWMEGMRWWPDTLPNVWLGTSAEDQPRFDERSAAMAAIAALGWPTTWCSAEPLLGAIDMRGAAWVRWLVVGGESGPGARPMHVDWARSLRDQCGSAAVPFFFKQWGEWTHEPLPMRDCWKQQDWHEWPASASHLDMPAAAIRVGKHRAGDRLDGRQHHEWPE